MEKSMEESIEESMENNFQKIRFIMNLYFPFKFAELLPHNKKKLDKLK